MGLLFELFGEETVMRSRQRDLNNIKVVLSVLLFVVTVIVAKKDYFGKGKWFCIAGTALSFLTVPYTRFMFTHETLTASFTFMFPNFTYMIVGILISICGLEIGALWNKMLLKKKNIK